MSGDYRAEVAAFTGWLRRQAAMVAPIAGAGLIIAPVLAQKGGMLALLLIAVICAIAALGLSALLAFDVALFRLMAGHADEISGGQAVDDFLAGAGLKPAPDRVRSLAERIAGARRLVLLQRAALAAMVLALGAAFVQRSVA